jgi:hypothetical protein
MMGVLSVFFAIVPSLTIVPAAIPASPRPDRSAAPAGRILGSLA